MRTAEENKKFVTGQETIRIKWQVFIDLAHTHEQAIKHADERNEELAMHANAFILGKI